MKCKQGDILTIIYIYIYIFIYLYKFSTFGVDGGKRLGFATTNLIASSNVSLHFHLQQLYQPVIAEHYH